MDNRHALPIAPSRPEYPGGFYPDKDPTFKEKPDPNPTFSLMKNSNLDPT